MSMYCSWSAWYTFESLFSRCSNYTNCSHFFFTNLFTGTCTHWLFLLGSCLLSAKFSQQNTKRNSLSLAFRNLHTQGFKESRNRWNCEILFFKKNYQIRTQEPGRRNMQKGRDNREWMKKWNIQTSNKKGWLNTEMIVGMQRVFWHLQTLTLFNTKFLSIQSATTILWVYVLITLEGGKQTFYS